MTWVLGGLSHGVSLGMKVGDVPERRKWGLQSLRAPGRPLGTCFLQSGVVIVVTITFYHRFMLFSPLRNENPESWLLIAALSLCLPAVSGAARTVKELAS